MNDLAHPAYRTVFPQMLEQYRPYLGKNLIGQFSVSEQIFSYYFNSDIIFNAYKHIHDPLWIQVLANQEAYLYIECPAAWVSIILHRFITPLSLKDLKNEMIVNAFEIACAPLIETIEQQYGLSIHLQPLTRRDVLEGKIPTQFTMIHQETHVEYPVNLYGQSDIVKGMMDHVFQGAADRPALSVSVDCKILSAVRQLPIGKIEQLQRGEIIIIMGARHLVEQPILIIEDRLALYGQLEGHAIQLTSSAQLKEQIQELIMNDGDNPELMAASEEDQNMASMADMRVPVSFELGRMDLPVSMLSKLKEGEVIDLQKPINENITMFANGKAVALGEVIQVGQNFGILVKDIL